MEIRIHLEKDEDDAWVATCPSLPGCISQGKTEGQALKNIKSAVKLHIKSLAEDGLPIFKSPTTKDRLVQVHV